MLPNVKVPPLPVEGNPPLYRWGSRFAIYTGLPTVVGWDNHLKTHDSILPGTYIDSRIAQVKDFYNTTDAADALDFLQRYHVQYIILGDLERKYYAAEGLAKFGAMATQGQLEQVYPEATAATTPDTTYVYEVKPITSAEGN